MSQLRKIRLYFKVCSTAKKNLDFDFALFCCCIFLSFHVISKPGLGSGIDPGKVGMVFLKPFPSSIG
jgi:hypothetical protein